MIIGTVGVPAKYGGFETLAENLCHTTGSRYVVYCESAAYPKPRANNYYGSELVFVPLRANGVSSLVYDAVSIAHALIVGYRNYLLLGVSGAWILPPLRLLFRFKIVVNIDGIEWKRAKWGPLARKVLKGLEKLAVKYSDEVVADNEGIRNYLLSQYGVDAELITYGGDHAILGPLPKFTKKYALLMCRIEPENNIEMILKAFERTQHKLVAVGNWLDSHYGRRLLEEYGDSSNINILSPVYDEHERFALRSQASMYVHGHQAGGTNPALVEMMYFGIPIFAYDCDYNRFSTENLAYYFDSVEALVELLLKESVNSERNCLEVTQLAQSKHVWAKVCEAYEQLLFD